MTRKCLSVTCIILALALALACTTLSAQAAPIGRFLQVEGQVDLLKGGKLPAAAAKVTDPVEIKDVIRTKSRARAQVLFVDDTTITLAPESRVAVADYFYDGNKGVRRTLLQVFQGLAHTVVKQVLPAQEPDFVIQTHTVVIGVRGTEWYTLILPGLTTVYNLEGLLDLRSSNPRVAGSLLLKALQYSEIRLDQPPGAPRDLTPAILSALRRMMFSGPGPVLSDPSGRSGQLPDVDLFKLPEALRSPYAPTLSPTPERTPSPKSPGTSP